jgi:osmotically-inducible protein OsmY
MALRITRNFLRGPVKSDQEKTEVGNKAKQIAGVKKVDNQLEIASNNWQF